MIAIFILFFGFFLTGCFQSSELGVIQSLSLRKQKQKISLLEKKLANVEELRINTEAEIEELKAKINEARLALIRKQIDSYEKRKSAPQVLFADERETLYDMIRLGSSTLSFEAQLELDRILRMITEQSEDTSNVF